MRRRTGRPPILGAATLCFQPALLLLAPALIAAQAIEGRVLDEQTGDPVATALVSLLDPPGNAVQSGLTDSAGAFSLTAPVPGRYRLRTERLGYLASTSPSLDVRAREVVRVELRLSVEAIPMAPLTIVSDRPALVLDPRLERQGFYERQELYGTKMGFGRFLDQEDLDRKVLMTASQIFQDVPGMRVRGAGGRRLLVTGRNGCIPTFYLDGADFGSVATIDEVLSPVDVVAVEIYPGHVWPARFPGRGCGVIVVWTGMRR